MLGFKVSRSFGRWLGDLLANWQPVFSPSAEIERAAALQCGAPGGEILVGQAGRSLQVEHGTLLEIGDLSRDRQTAILRVSERDIDRRAAWERRR